MNNASVQLVRAPASVLSSAPPKRAPPRLLSVLRKKVIGEKLIRITFTGDELHGFPINSHGAHIKLFFPRGHQTQPILPRLTSQGVVWPPTEEKPITRTYSVRAFREDKNELDVEFVKHCAESPASGWAQSAKEGDRVGLAGPGGPNPLLASAHWHLLVGDLSAVPAIAALLESMSNDSVGHVFIEIDNITDQITISHPPLVHVQWLLRQPGQSTLLRAIESLHLPIDVKKSGFIAGESSAVVAVRNHLVKNYDFSKSNLYAVPYWRRGDNEEMYHADRHKIMDEEY